MKANRSVIIVIVVAFAVFCLVGWLCSKAGVKEKQSSDKINEQEIEENLLEEQVPSVLDSESDTGNKEEQTSDSSVILEDSSNEEQRENSEVKNDDITAETNDDESKRDNVDGIVLPDDEW